MSNLVQACNCKVDKFNNPNGAYFQNVKYGANMRVHTVGIGQICCTVCGKTTKVATKKEDKK